MIADLYIRVSTDEQAENGFSQREQQERLLKYCHHHDIAVRNIILEDYSAKTFNRPRWQEMLAALKNRKKQIDTILFVKWDRFSRNTGDAYQMINLLRKLQVEVQAIDQPLDLSIPESKIMLAVYLATPEVENDRKALNVFHGMRRARKEGRYMCSAPVGYLNKITEDQKKYIAIDPDQAPIIRWVFETIEKGLFHIEHVYKDAKKRGLRCQRANFWNLIKNPVYCGQIPVPAYKDEAYKVVPGQHEKIISTELFYAVQDELNGKRRKQRINVGECEELVLRGFILCPRCGKLLTGSASKGRSARYFYYHCNAKCGARFKSAEANHLFHQELRKWIPRKGTEEAYEKVIQVLHEKRNRARLIDINSANTKIEELNNQLSTARRKYMMDRLDESDYRSFKKECEDEIDQLEKRLAQFHAQSPQINGLLKRAVNNVCNLEELYAGGDIPMRRKIIGSIYPEKLTFSGTTYRTARVNEVVSLIYSLDAGSGGNKNGETEQNFDFSTWVTRPGFEPRQAEPESAVLPLYYRAIVIWDCKYSAISILNRG